MYLTLANLVGSDHVVVRMLALSVLHTTLNMLHVGIGLHIVGQQWYLFCNIKIVNICIVFQGLAGPPGPPGPPGPSVSMTQFSNESCEFDNDCINGRCR